MSGFRMSGVLDKIPRYKFPVFIVTFEYDKELTMSLYDQDTQLLSFYDYNSQHLTTLRKRTYYL